MTLLNFIAETGRFLGSGIVTNILFAFGYLLISRDKFAKLFICTIVMGLLFNIALKVTFKVPLENIYGYAVPSGHTQFFVVLWGCMLIEYKNMLVLIMSCISILLIGFYLVYFGYHNIYDVFYGLLSGLPGLFTYYYLYKKQKKLDLLFYSLLIATALVIYIYILEGLYYPKYSLFFYFLLIIFCVSYYINRILFKDQRKKNNYKFIIYKIIFAALLLLSCHHILKYLCEDYALMRLYNLPYSNLICNAVMLIMTAIGIDALFFYSLKILAAKK